MVDSVEILTDKKTLTRAQKRYTKTVFNPTSPDGGSGGPTPEVKFGVTSPTSPAQNWYKDLSPALKQQKKMGPGSRLKGEARG